VLSVAHESRILAESIVLARLFFLNDTGDSILLVLDMTTRVHHWLRKNRKRDTDGSAAAPVDDVLLRIQVGGGALINPEEQFSHLCEGEHIPGAESAFSDLSKIMSRGSDGS
jgi:hypothetical protein